MAVVTVARYRLITHDTTTPADEVTARIEDATEMIEEALDRPLESVARTETVRITNDPRGWAGWRAYPRSTPITAIPVDSTYAIEDTVTLSSVTPDSDTTWETIPEPVATVTWTGGFDVDTLPRTLAHAICDLAHALAVPSPVPVGVTSVRSGDQAITYATGSSHDLDSYVTGLWERIKRFRSRRSQ